jgi:hypothetical protein
LAGLCSNRDPWGFARILREFKRFVVRGGHNRILLLAALVMAVALPGTAHAQEGLSPEFQPAAV